MSFTPESLRAKIAECITYLQANEMDLAEAHLEDLIESRPLVIGDKCPSEAPSSDPTTETWRKIAPYVDQGFRALRAGLPALAITLLQSAVEWIAVEFNSAGEAKANLGGQENSCLFRHLFRHLFRLLACTSLTC
jgi:hypothetical protein